MPAARTAIVIGGGIAGPVTAIALRKAGIEADVYEAYPPSARGIGGDLALAANGVRALDLIGAGDAVREAALPITGQTISIGGNDIGLLPALDDVEPLRVINRGVLHTILRDRAEEAGVVFHFDKRLIGADSDATGATARFGDGSAASADILIGADGVRSVVRSLIDPAAPAAGYTGLLGFQVTIPASDLPHDLTVDGHELEPGVMTFAFGRRAYYLFWRNADGSVTWGANLPSKKYLSTAEARAIPVADWLTTLRETYAGDVPGDAFVTATTEQNLEVLGAIHIMPPVPHWHRDRLVLVGDAVHAPSNSTGQGGSLAIESAIQLARCLRDLTDVPSAFAAYETLRRDRVEKITRRGARTNSAKTPGPVARRIMRVAMPLMFRAMNFEKTMGPEQRYSIDWEAPVRQASTAPAN